MIKNGDHRRRVEAVVRVELENRVGAVFMHRIESEQLGGPRAIHGKVGPDHDRGAGGADVDAAIGAVKALEVTREVGRPR